MGDHVSTALAAHVIQKFIRVVVRKRRHVEPTDPVIAQDLERLLPQIGSVVDHELLGQPAQNDRVYRLGKSRIRLRGGGIVPRNLRLDHRSLLDGPDRLTGLAVEGEDQTLLGVLDQRRDFHPVHGQIHQNRGRSDIVVPLVAVMDLKVPATFSRPYIESEDAPSEEVVARPMARVRLYGRSVRDDVDEAQLGIR